LSSVIHRFDESGIVRGADGVARYHNRPRSLVEMLRGTVEKWPGNEAVSRLAASGRRNRRCALAQLSKAAS